MARLNGRCFCGSVTLRVSGDVRSAVHCHCQSCRRATSSPVTTFFTVARADAVLEGEGLRFFASSPGVKRGFCGFCGSPMSFETEKRPEEIDFYLATLDDASGIEVESHSYWSERVAWLHVEDELPKEG